METGVVGNATVTLTTPEFITPVPVGFRVPAVVAVALPLEPVHVKCVESVTVATVQLLGAAVVPKKVFCAAVPELTPVI